MFGCMFDNEQSGTLWVIIQSFLEKQPFLKIN